MKAMTPKTRQRRKGQSLVEFALGGILLVMLLAAAVDFGRAYYTFIVVNNMAGEGAVYLAQHGDVDYDYTKSGHSAKNDDTWQGRARNVAARTMGGVIDNTKVNLANGDVSARLLRNIDSDPELDDAGPLPLTPRCAGTNFEVKVVYHMNDLFFPGILGFRDLPLGASAPSAFVSSNGTCP